MRRGKRLGRLNLTLALAIVSSLLAPGGTLAADTSVQNDNLSTAVYPSDGKKFLGHTQWSHRDGGWIDAAKWVAGDFTGDGKADIAAIWDDGGGNTLTVSQSSGSGFTRSHWAAQSGGWSASSTWLAGDFTGDGKVDLAGAWNDGGQLSTAVYPSDGTRFLGQTQWSSRDGGWIGAARWAAGDFNGDGKADLAGAWNDADPVAEHLRPGTHTLALEADQSTARVSVKTFQTWQGECI